MSFQVLSHAEGAGACLLHARVGCVLRIALRGRALREEAPRTVLERCGGVYPPRRQRPQHRRKLPQRTRLAAGLHAAAHGSTGAHELPQTDQSCVHRRARAPDDRVHRDHRQRPDRSVHRPRRVRSHARFRHSPALHHHRRSVGRTPQHDRRPQSLVRRDARPGRRLRERRRSARLWQARGRGAAVLRRRDRSAQADAARTTSSPTSFTLRSTIRAAANHGRWTCTS